MEELPEAASRFWLAIFHLHDNAAGATIPVGQDPVTAGNRSGTFAITQNAIDALIAGTTGQQQVAPGFFGLSGTIGNATFQAVIRGLNQKRGNRLAVSAQCHYQERSARSN